MKNGKVSFKRSFAMFLAILMLVTSAPILAFATDESGVKPDPGSTQLQPFISNQPSYHYRIPNLVSLDDGTLVAGADAGWDGGSDGGGTDSMIAVSTDKGNNWNNFFTTYYPDNGNRFSSSSTGTCDSELATDGKIVYSLTQFFPAGYSLTTRVTDNELKKNNGTAFDDQGRLKLFKNGQAGSFNYYLGAFDSEGPEGRAIIYNNDGTPTEHKVDHEYFLYKNDTKQDGCLFYSDAMYQTAKVNFLLFRKSTDGGKTWSAFTPLNVKNGSEAFYGVGPGRGLVVDYSGAENGKRILFSCYSWSGGDSSQRSSFIYSDDGGRSWNRTGNFPELPKYAGLSDSTVWSSENQLVQMDSRTIRCFVRNGWGKVIYADAILQADGSYSWTDYTDCQFVINGGKPGVGTNNNGCQLSAIKYSKRFLFNGQYCTAVFISTPVAKRANGKIYTLLFNENNEPINVNNANQNNNKSIEYELTTNGGFFAYSCLTELPDGSIAILYESNTGNPSALTFRILDPDKITGGLREENPSYTYDYKIIKGDSKTYLVDGNEVSNSNPNSIAIDLQKRTGTKAHHGDDANFNKRELWLKEALYTFNQNEDNTWLIHNQSIYLTIYKPGTPSTVERKSVKIVQDGSQFLFIDGGNEALYYYKSGDKQYQFDRSTAHGHEGSNGDQHRIDCLFDVFRLAMPNDTETSSEVPGFIRVTDASEIKDGEQYLIGCKVDGVYHFLYPSMFETNAYSHSVRAESTPYDAGYFMTVTALKKGESTILADPDTYNFTVLDYSREIIGVVDYDPVIYTHGKSSAGMDDMDITFCGNLISDASYPGEKETAYRFRSEELSKQYRITKIETLDAKGINAVASEVKLTNESNEIDGKLHGTLNLANTTDYSAYNKVSYVTLKTYLEELSTHEVYTQTDRLCVASNPVPGHILSGRNAATGSASIQLATFLLANGSYGNTINLKEQSGAGYVHNAKHLFVYGDKYGEDTSLCYKNDVADLRQLGWDKANKIAGILENGSSGNSTGDNTMSYVLAENKLAGTTVAYYYYDKSSPKNEGITADPNDPSNFSLVIKRQKVNVEYTKSGSDTWNKDAILDDNSGNGIYIKKYSGDGGTIGPLGTNAFGTSSKSNLASSEYTYAVGSEAQQKDVVVPCTTQVEPNTTKTMKGVASITEKAIAQRGNVIKYYAQGINLVKLPFEIVMCDKSKERAAYNSTVSKVLKSTDFTTTSWKNYMDSVLNYQEYLNNYTLLTTADVNSDGETYESLFTKAPVDKDGKPLDASTVDTRYDIIQKAATFATLEKEIDNNTEIFENGIETIDGKVYTPSSFVPFENAYNEANSFMDSDKSYRDEEERKDIAGWEVGPASETKLPIQEAIEEKAAAVNSSAANLKVAGDATVYEEARSLSRKIDRTAYENAGNAIDEQFVDSDGTIYTVYNHRRYVDIAEENQTEIDAEITKVLTEMSISHKSASDQTVKKYNVIVNVNGTKVAALSGQYLYGTIANLDFSPYIKDGEVVKCLVTTYADYQNTASKLYDTTVNLADYKGFNYILPVVIQNDMVFDLKIDKSKDSGQVIVQDYFGTVLAVLSGDSVTVSGTTVTTSGGSISAKMSPKYEFTGWSVEDGTYSVEKTMTIVQRGTLNSSVHVISAENGTVNGRQEFASNYLNLKLTLDSPSAMYWTRTVNGYEQLASYESSFVNFSSDEDVIYKAYNSFEALPDNVQGRVAEKQPALYGTAYAANGAFTMSVDYSAPSDVKVVDAGIIYSTSDLGKDGFVKGGAGAFTYAANRIAHWTNNQNSGTFTMTKSKGIDTGAHYMRAYVSYTIDYKGYTLPFVVYGTSVYKYENGVVTAVQYE